MAQILSGRSSGLRGGSLGEVEAFGLLGLQDLSGQRLGYLLQGRMGIFVASLKVYRSHSYMKA